MKQKRLENICQEILSYVEKDYEISEEMVLALAQGLTFYNGREEKMPSSYIRLLDEIGQKWQYRETEQLSIEQTFVIGSVWGCLQMAEARRRYALNETSKVQQWNVLLKKYADKVYLLNIIRRKPGIRHKDLAQRSGKSPSQMTQIMAGMINDRIVTYNYTGREKFYFITELGQKLCQEDTLKRKQKQTSKLSWEMFRVENDEKDILQIPMRVTPKLLYWDVNDIIFRGGEDALTWAGKEMIFTNN